MVIEFRIKKLTRYTVTRYETSDNPDDDTIVANLGTFDNADQAYHVGYALAQQQAHTLGLSTGSKGVIFPKHPAGKKIRHPFKSA